MYFKLFGPFLILLVYQLISFFVLDDFDYVGNDYINCLVVFSYLLSIFSILFSSFFYKNDRAVFLKNEKKNNLKNINFFVIFLTLFFIIKPTLVLIAMNIELGAEQVRQIYYNEPGIYNKIYGIGFIGSITNFYLVPFFWLYSLLICDRQDKLSVYTFYFLVISLATYNASYAGRFFMYFALLVMYMRFTLLGVNFLKFLSRLFLIVAIIFYVSLIIVANRSGRENLQLLELFESVGIYHSGGIFFLAHKMEQFSPYLSTDYYPFRILIENLTAPIKFILGGSMVDMTYVDHVSGTLANPTLYNFERGTYFNAFSTFFYFLYIDFLNLTPIFSFIYIFYIVLSAKLISNNTLRWKYLSFVALVLYFSLFQAQLFSPGYTFIIFLFPIFIFLFNSFKLTYSKG